jgi:hypothetical protein
MTKVGFAGLFRCLVIQSIRVTEETPVLQWGDMSASCDYPITRRDVGLKSGGPIGKTANATSIGSQKDNLFILRADATDL